MTWSIDSARLTLMLNDLRLPAIKQDWSSFAERSDKESRPAARFPAGDGAGRSPRLRLPPRHDLPGPRRWRRDHHAGGQHRGDERILEGDQHPSCPRRLCLLVCDGAGWHQAAEQLEVPDNITLLRLPPYAPKPNPMENIWDDLRGNKLCNRSGTAMRPLLTIAARPGTSGSAILTASAQSLAANGHESGFTAVDIIIDPQD